MVMALIEPGIAHPAPGAVGHYGDAGLCVCLPAWIADLEGRPTVGLGGCDGPTLIVIAIPGGRSCRGVGFGSEIEDIGQQQWVVGIAVFVAAPAPVRPLHFGQLPGRVVTPVKKRRAVLKHAHQACALFVFDVFEVDAPAVGADEPFEPAGLAVMQPDHRHVISKHGQQPTPVIELQRAAAWPSPGPAHAVVRDAGYLMQLAHRLSAEFARKGPIGLGIEGSRVPVFDHEAVVDTGRLPVPGSLPLATKDHTSPVALDDLQLASCAGAGRDEPCLEGVAPADAQRAVEAMATVVMPSQYEGHDGRSPKIDFVPIFVAGDQIDRVACASGNTTCAQAGGFVGKVADRRARACGRPACRATGALGHDRRQAKQPQGDKADRERRVNGCQCDRRRMPAAR